MLEGMNFMQDGAPLYIDQNVKQMLIHHFIDAGVISPHFPKLWPPGLILGFTEG